MFSKKKTYPYAKQSISWQDIWEVIKILRSPWLTQGPTVKSFEEALCKETGAKYAVTVANGSIALDFAVAALELEPGFAGIATPNTFVASANCILRAGGNVIFADIQKTTGNIDPEEIAKQITPQTKVMIPVHFAGQSCDMQAIHALAKKHNLYVIEDGAHAIGSDYNVRTLRQAQGERTSNHPELVEGHDRVNKVGSCKYSDMTIFSFHPVKTIAAGEGGAITTNNKELYEKLIMLRTIGITKNSAIMTQNDGPWYYQMHHLSTNGRLSDLHAALGLSQLKRLAKFKQRRREIVKLYKELLGQDNRFSFIEEQSYSNACWHLCPLMINFDVVKKTKNQIFDELKTHGLNLQVHYIPVHTQPYYQKLGFKQGDYPNAEDYYKKTLTLPLYPILKDKEVHKIADIIKQVVV